MVITLNMLVGPIQAVYMGYFKKEDFNMMINHLEIKVEENSLDACVKEIDEIEKLWKTLNVEQELKLEFNVK